MKLWGWLVALVTMASGAAAAPRASMLFDETFFCGVCSATYGSRTWKDVISGVYPDLQLIPRMTPEVLEPALATTDVLFVPFIGNAGQAGQLPQGTIDALRRFVEGGGKMILRMHHPLYPGTRDLVERTFGIPFAVANELSTPSYTCDAAAARNMGFRRVPEPSRAPYYVEVIDGALPAGAVSICKVGTDRTLLAAKSFGDGMIFFEGIYNLNTMDYSPEQALLTREMGEADLVGSHRCFLQNGSLKCSGGNAKGQLGIGDRNPHVTAYGSLPPVNLGAGFQVGQTSNSIGSSCAVSTAGELKCWGLNKDGQLGLGDIRPRGAEPSDLGDQLPAIDLGAKVKDVSVGRTHACALTEDGNLHCWGNGARGQLGSEMTTTVGAAAGDVPVVPDVAGRVTAVGAGRDHTCVALEDQKVACFGDNSLGQLGIGSRVNVGDKTGTMGRALRRVDLGSSFKVVKLATGLDFNCALSDRGRIKCWGVNDMGQLGQGVAVPSRGTVPTEMGDALPFTDLGEKQLATNLQCGFYHCCAMTVQNTMKCWGANDAGQLGIGDNQSRGRSADMGDNLPFAKLPSGEPVLAIDLNGDTTCASTTSGTRCWGGNATGQLATGDMLNRADTPGTIPRLLMPMF